MEHFYKNMFFFSKVWEYFIEICSQNDSFHGLSWTQFRSQLESAEMAKAYVLNPLAPEFVPNRLYHVTIGAAESFMQSQSSLANPSTLQHPGAHQQAAAAAAAAAAYGTPLVTPVCIEFILLGENYVEYLQLIVKYFHLNLYK